VLDCRNYAEEETYLCRNIDTDRFRLDLFWTKNVKLNNTISIYNPLLTHVMIGVLAGVVLLHPFTMVIYWFEFHHVEFADSPLWGFVISRMARSFTDKMLGMTGIFALLGGSLGLAFGMYHRALTRRNRLVSSLADELARDLPSFIEGGESESVEFKASARWDYRQSKLNKSLEDTVIKTIAGFMNNHGGTLLIGVDDQGSVIGIEDDYTTLKKNSRDGFQQYVMNTISTRIGTDMCPLIHVVFHNFEGKDVCRLLIEASPRPVYVKDKSTRKYFLRVGNATRELDVHEAIEYLKQRWPEL